MWNKALAGLPHILVKLKGRPILYARLDLGARVSFGMYGLQGDNRAWSLSPMAEAHLLKRCKYGFDPHRDYMNKPQTTLRVTNNTTGKVVVLNLYEVRTREDVIIKLNIDYPKKPNYYPDILIDHVWASVQEARGEDDISHLTDLLEEIKSYGLDLDSTPKIERRIKEHYIRREFFHPGES